MTTNESQSRDDEIIQKNRDNFIRNANKLHENKYCYDQINYKYAREKVDIMCPLHGGFSVTPHKHLNRKQGCPTCKKDKKAIENKQKSIDIFLKNVKKNHDNNYDLSLIDWNEFDISSNIKVKCHKHGDFDILAKTFQYGSGCIKCIRYVKSHKKDIKLYFNKTDWIEYEDTNIWFSKQHDFAYNEEQNSKLYPGKTGYINISRINKSVCFIKALWNIFHGDFDSTSTLRKRDDHKGNYLSNLHLIKNICLSCGKIFANSKNNARKFCNKQCSDLNTKNKSNQQRRSNLRKFIQTKINPWKNKNFNVDDVIVKVPGIVQKVCQYCGLKNLNLANDNPQDPNKLTIDAKTAGNHSDIDNLIASCLFCNRLKNDIPYDEWNNCILPFFKGEKDLDLSKKSYSKNQAKIEEKSEVTTRTYPWQMMKRENPEKYLTNESARKEFCNLYVQQNGMCPYSKVPILYLQPGYRLNASCDQVAPSNSSNHQLTLQCLNFAKNNLSCTEFQNELKIRGFFQNTHVKVILPEKYFNDSSFIYKMNTGLRVGKNSNKAIIANINGKKKEFETIKKASEKLGISTTSIYRSIKNNKPIKNIFFEYKHECDKEDYNNKSDENRKTTYKKSYKRMFKENFKFDIFDDLKFKRNNLYYRINIKIKDHKEKLFSVNKYPSLYKCFEAANKYKQKAFCFRKLLIYSKYML